MWAELIGPNSDKKRLHIFICPINGIRFKEYDFLNFVYVPDKLRTKLLRSKMEDREFDRAGHEDCCQFK